MSSGGVEAAIRSRLVQGQTLYTPTQRATFTVSEIDAEGVILLLGQGRTKTRLNWACLEGIPNYVDSNGGDIEIGGVHQTVGRPGTLDAYLKGCVKRTTAGWVAVLLETAGIARIIRDSPARIRML